jgi:ATP-dependent Clp protease ATP-binding subunit ClpB
VDFRNTIIVLTSNLGAQHLVELKDNESVEKARNAVMDAVKQAFRPEFLNRLDEIILFHRLAKAQMGAIVDIQIQYLEKLLKDRQITLSLDDAARYWLGDKGYDPIYGARPLKRVIQKNVQDRLANMILDGSIGDGAHVSITGTELGLHISVGTAPEAASGKAAKK